MPSDRFDLGGVFHGHIPGPRFRAVTVEVEMPDGLPPIVAAVVDTLTNPTGKPKHGVVLCWCINELMAQGIAALLNIQAGQINRERTLDSGSDT